MGVKLNYKNAPQGVTKKTFSVSDEVVGKARAQGYNIQTVYGATNFPDHNNLRCLDFMINTGGAGGQEGGDWIARYVIKNADRLVVNWMIWDRRIWRRKANNHGPAGWSQYFGPNPHTDHVHLECADGSYVALSGTTKSTGDGYPTPTECIIYHDKVKPGVKNSDSVWWVQRWLNNVQMPEAPLVKKNGIYGAKTIEAVKVFQRQKCDDPPDGDLGPMQTEFLFHEARKHNPKLPVAKFEAHS
jgi:hypothetical protein